MKKASERSFIKKYMPVIAFVAIATPIAVYFLVALPFPPAFGMGKDAWLSYYGSFLGGLFGGVATMYAVQRTLEDNQNREDESNRLNIIPYIDVKVRFEEPKLDLRNMETRYWMVITNVGLGTAIEVEMNHQFGLWERFEKKQNPNYKNQTTLSPNNPIEVYCTPYGDKKDGDADTFDIQYWDVIHKNKYKQTIEVLFTSGGFKINSIGRQELI